MWNWVGHCAFSARWSSWETVGVAKSSPSWAWRPPASACLLGAGSRTQDRGTRHRRIRVGLPTSQRTGNPIGWRGHVLPPCSPANENTRYIVMTFHLENVSHEVPVWLRKNTGCPQQYMRGGNCGKLTKWQVSIKSRRECGGLVPTHFGKWVVVTNVTPHSLPPRS